MSPRFALGLGLALAGCAARPALDAPPGHPAHLDAPVAPAVVEVAALPPVAPLDLPAPLRPDGTPPGGMAGHSAMGHSAMDHGEGAADLSGMDAPAPPSALGDALDAYLAVHDALADDRLDTAAADAFSLALSRLVETPPADDAHFWHMRGDAVATLRQSAGALAEAGDLDAARAAFGALSVPFADAVAAMGTPAELDLVRHTCGMADAPQGGVWVQRTGDVRNPYFGTSMLMCSRGAETLPSAGHDAMDHDAMDHDAMDHEGMR